MTSESSATVSFLSSTEVCDACPARARVTAYKTVDERDLELVFCLHHASKHLAELITQGFLVDVEETDALTKAGVLA